LRFKNVFTENSYLAKSILDAPGEPVTKFDGDLKKLVNNMFETMYSAPGVGLAAVQVGVPKRLFVMDCSAGKDPAQRIVMINPEVVGIEGKQDGDEGCLSFPGIFFSVQRNLRAIVRATMSTERVRAGRHGTDRALHAARNGSLRRNSLFRQDDSTQTRDRKTQD